MYFFLSFFSLSRLELQQVRGANSHFGMLPPDHHGANNNSSSNHSHSHNRKLSNNSVQAHRVRKLTKFFGDEPPLLRLFLKDLGYEKYASAFEEARIGLLELPCLSEDRLERLGVPMGPRMRIMQEARAGLMAQPTTRLLQQQHQQHQQQHHHHGHHHHHQQQQQQQQQQHRSAQRDPNNYNVYIL